MTKRLLLVLTVAIAACLSPAEDIQQVRQALNGGAGGAMVCGELCADKLVIPSDHPTADWVADPRTFPYAPADDHTLKLGWNADNTDPTEPRLYLLFESNYQPTPAHPALMEWHVQGFWPDSTIRRPITLTADRDTKVLDVGIRGQFSLRDSTATSLRFKITDGLTPSWQMFGVSLDWQINNHRMLSGLNAGSSGYVEAVRISAADEVLIAAGGHATRTAGPLHVKPAGLSRFEVNATGVGMHGNTPQPQCAIGDADTATMLVELLQCLHERGDVAWAGMAP